MSGGFHQAHWEPLGFEQIENADLSTAIKLQHVPDRADFAIIEVNGGAGSSVRWIDDGQIPTGSYGMVANSTDEPFFYHGDLNAIQFIVDAATPVLHVSYYAYK